MKSRTREYAESGTANGFFLYLNGCSEWARDLTTLRDMRFLPFDEAILDAINADWGATKLTLPARLLNGVDEDITVAGWRQHFHLYGLPGVSGRHRAHRAIGSRRRTHPRQHVRILVLGFPS